MLQALRCGQGLLLETAPDAQRVLHDQSFMSTPRDGDMRPSEIRGRSPRCSWLCQSPCTVWVFLDVICAALCDKAWQTFEEIFVLRHLPCPCLPVGNQATIEASAGQGWLLRRQGQNKEDFFASM